MAPRERKYAAAGKDFYGSRTIRQKMQKEELHFPRPVDVSYTKIPPSPKECYTKKTLLPRRVPNKEKKKRFGGLPKGKADHFNIRHFIPPRVLTRRPRGHHRQKAKERGGCQKVARPAAESKGEPSNYSRQTFSEAVRGKWV